MPLLTRPFQISDVGLCADLFIETFSRPPWNECWAREIVEARLNQIAETPHSFGLLAEDDGVVGFALGFSEPWHEGSHFYLKEMCVHPDFQRRGIGSGMMESLTEKLRDLDTRRIYLLTARGDMSENFYSKIGFYTSPKMILMARHII